MIDPLAEIVSMLQPSLSFSKAASGSGNWRVDGAGDGSPFFAVILEGSARLAINGQPSIELEENDFVLIPAAYRFTMSSNSENLDEDDDPLRVTRLGDETRHGDPIGMPNMRVLIGRLAFGSPDTTLVFALLPCLLHVCGQARLTTLVQMIREEAQGDRPAKEIVLERQLQLLLIEALRSDAAGLETPGLLRGLADKNLGPVIRQMHEKPAKAWTVEELASTAMLSRSVFFDRFQKQTGMAPMEYLLSWRMALAKDMLRRKEGGMKEIARRIGYGSASAFSVAFSRFVGVAPSQYGYQIPMVSKAPAP
ncbi:AraC family transcriptional regulator [Aquamicrobium sp. LC103]|uniref:AraC family transcriptional regulator n=1 Tax=Aquamicrobium sp. LC103 TaxID=1120658 RepID=UPI00063E6D1A|nr:AraC family transcriptional regulator [Aquamicrobium sp. LC103]TKT82590.1 AraC family transcriptional regulator [Aquamicrobium sp. LC103]